MHCTWGSATVHYPDNRQHGDRQNSCSLVFVAAPAALGSHLTLQHLGHNERRSGHFFFSVGILHKVLMRQTIIVA